MLDFLRSEGISGSIIERIEEFRREYPADESVNPLMEQKLITLHGTEQRDRASDIICA